MQMEEGIWPRINADERGSEMKSANFSPVFISAFIRVHPRLISSSSW